MSRKRGHLRWNVYHIFITSLNGSSIWFFMDMKWGLRLCIFCSFGQCFGFKICENLSIVKLRSCLPVQSKSVRLIDDFSPVTNKCNNKIKIYQKAGNYTLVIWQLDLTCKIKTRWQEPWMVIHHPQDGRPTSQGWSPTFPRMVTHHPKSTRGNILQARIWHLDLNHNIKTRWQLPWMVTHHPKSTRRKCTTDSDIDFAT